jgi:hypothetical protein
MVPNHARYQLRYTPSRVLDYSMPAVACQVSSHSGFTPNGARQSFSMAREKAKNEYQLLDRRNAGGLCDELMLLAVLPKMGGASRLNPYYLKVRHM